MEDITIILLNVSHMIMEDMVIHLHNFIVNKRVIQVKMVHSKEELEDVTQDMLLREAVTYAFVMVYGRSNYGG